MNSSEWAEERLRRVERRLPSLQVVHNVTCERCLLSHNGQPVGDNVIMVGRTDLSADRKSNKSLYERRVTRIFAWRNYKPPTSTQLIQKVSHSDLFHIMNGIGNILMLNVKTIDNEL